MTQTTITGIENMTELEQLYYKRKQLYNNLRERLLFMNNRKRELITNYRQAINQIDKDIMYAEEKIKHMNKRARVKGAIR